MNIIDAHMHFSNLKAFKETALNESRLDYSLQGLLREHKVNGIRLGIGMGLTETTESKFPSREVDTPMGLDLESSIPDHLVYCPGINPYRLSEKNLIQLEEELKKQSVVGIKIYLGYYDFYAFSQVYHPVYELAKAYSLPVVFHTGDTFSEKGLLKYSHPLTIDEVAVAFRDVNFVIAHFGDPWVLDAAEVVYKNDNVYADLSGLINGTEEDVDNLLQGRYFDHLLHALAYLDNYKKLIFGTDWPIVAIRPYIKLIRQIVPLQYHEDVFYNTALKVYSRINNIKD